MRNDTGKLKKQGIASFPKNDVFTSTIFVCTTLQDVSLHQTSLIRPRERIHVSNSEVLSPLQKTILPLCPQQNLGKPILTSNNRTDESKHHNLRLQRRRKAAQMH